MSVIVRRAAESRDLVKPDDIVSLLSLTDANDIGQVKRLVTALSRTVEDMTDRVFARELVTEKIGVDRLDVGAFGVTGVGPFRIMLQRTPVLMIQAIRYDGSELTLSDFSLENSDAGFLFCESGFSPTMIEIQQIEQVRSQYMDPLWEIDYSAGFTLPTFTKVQSTFATTDVDVDTDTFSLTGHNLVDGDTVKFVNDGGTLPGGIYDYVNYIIRDSDADTFKVASQPNGDAVDVTDVGTGTHQVIRQTTMPASLQNDIIQLVVSEFRSRLRDRTIKSEKLGDYSVTYEDQIEIPKTLQTKLNRYKDVV